MKSKERKRFNRQSWRRQDWRINVYKCRDCSRLITSVDVDEGTTPFMIGCVFCEKGMAYSSFYPKERPVPARIDSPHIEFFKPTSDSDIISHLEFCGVKSGDELFESCLDGTRDHVKNGGLIYRKRTDAEPVCHEKENQEGGKVND